MLPDDNGYRVCETLRQRDETVPIIILTAKAQESDKIRGLDAGADDYVTKPFSVAELIARINAIFRRQARMARTADETFTIGSWQINARKHTMTQRPDQQAADVLRARGPEAAARAPRRDGVARRAAREGLGHPGVADQPAPSTTSSSSCAASSRRTRRARATSSRSTAWATSSCRSRRPRGAPCTCESGAPRGSLLVEVAGQLQLVARRLGQLAARPLVDDALQELGAEVLVRAVAGTRSRRKPSA